MSDDYNWVVIYEEANPKNVLDLIHRTHPFWVSIPWTEFEDNMSILYGFYCKSNSMDDYRYKHE